MSMQYNAAGGIKKNPCTSTFSTMRGYYVAVTFVICQHRGLLTGSHGLIRPSWPLEGGRTRDCESERHDPYLLSITPTRVTLMEFHRESRSARIVTRSQFVCPRIRTYVGHVIHGIIHATNPRYQKIPPGLYTRAARPLCACAYVYVWSCHPRWHPHTPTHTHARFMGYLETGTGNYVGQIDDCNRILINSMRFCVGRVISRLSRRPTLVLDNRSLSFWESKVHC